MEMDNHSKMIFADTFIYSRVVIGSTYTIVGRTLAAWLGGGKHKGRNTQYLE